MSEFHSAALIASVTTEQLWAMSEHPVSGRAMVQCPVEVTWLRSCEATLLFMHGGKQVAEFGTYTDYYGFLTCLQDLQARALATAEKFSVTPQSTACIAIRLIVQDSPVLPATSGPSEFGWRAPIPPTRQRWAEFPVSKFRRRVADVDQDDEGPGGKEVGTAHGWLYPALEPKPVYNEIIWTTAHPDNPSFETLVSNLRERFLPKPPTEDNTTAMSDESSAQPN